MGVKDIENWGYTDIWDPLWKGQEVKVRIRDQLGILIILLAMLVSILMVFVWAGEGFRITARFFIILAIAVVICIPIYIYFSRITVRWIKKAYGGLVLRGYSTKKGFEEILEDLKKLFEKHEIEAFEGKDIWFGSRLFTTSDDETLLIFDYDERMVKNLKIEIFDAKKYPKAKRILKDFFDGILFTDSEGKIYLKASDESRGTVIKSIRKKSIRSQIDLLKATSKTPWYAYFYCGFGMFFSGTLGLVVMTQHFEDVVMGLLFNIMLLAVFIMCSAMMIWIYKRNKRDKERLRELEDMYKTM